MRKDIAGQITVQFVSLFKGSFFTISVFFSSSQATEMEGWGGQWAASHKEEIRWASSTKSMQQGLEEARRAPRRL